MDFCGKCKFWEPKHRDFDFTKGECRRHAPIPDPAQGSQILELLSLIAWAVENTAEIKHQGGDDNLDTIYQAYEKIEQHEVHAWPITLSSDWCGQFDARIEKFNVKCDLERMDQATQWEQEVKLNKILRKRWE